MNKRTGRDLQKARRQSSIINSLNTEKDRNDVSRKLLEITVHFESTEDLVDQN